MKITINDPVIVENYQVGDIIILKSGTYTITKTPAQHEYYLLCDNHKDWANGSWSNITDMIKNVKGNPHFKHYSKDKYTLQLVRKK
ncbi:cell wall hydrolase [Bacillus phage vB_BcgM]|nr:cell wall hydrolase [Bacillus phage vB_BcgM]